MRLITPPGPQVTAAGAPAVENLRPTQDRGAWPGHEARVRALPDRFRLSRIRARRRKEDGGPNGADECLFGAGTCEPRAARLVQKPQLRAWDGRETRRGQPLGP